MWAIFLVSTLLVFVPSTVKCSCIDPWVQYSDYCVWALPYTVTWNAAEATCNSFGTKLATITESGFNSFVKGLLKGGERYWLAYKVNFDTGTIVNQDDGTSVHLGYPWNMYKPRKNQAQSRCVAIVGGDVPKWVAKPCSFQYRAVCQYSTAT